MESGDLDPPSSKIWADVDADYGRIQSLASLPPKIIVEHNS